MRNFTQDRYDDAVESLKKLNNDLFYEDFKEKSRQIIEAQQRVADDIKKLEENMDRIRTRNDFMVKKFIDGLSENIEPIILDVETRFAKKNRELEEIADRHKDVQKKCSEFHEVCSYLVQAHKEEVERLTKEVTSQYQTEKREIDEKIAGWISETRATHIELTRELVAKIDAKFATERDRQQKHEKIIFAVIIGVFLLQTGLIYGVLKAVAL